MQIFSAPVVLPVSGAPIRDGAVAVEAGRIVAVGPADQLPPGERVAFDGVLTPGLVNAHTHLCFSAYADHFGNGKEFSDWIKDFGPRNATMSAKDWRASVRTGIEACLRAGVTGVADVVTGPAALSAMLDSGLSGTAYYEACFIDKPRWNDQMAEFVQIIDEAKRQQDNRWYHAYGKPDAIGDDRGLADLVVGISPHTLYTLARSVGHDLAEIAHERALPLHPHLAETRHEHDYVRSGTGVLATMVGALAAEFELLNGGSGVSPAFEMDAWGLLGPESHVAHGVHLDAADRALLRDRGTYVALCARSNARLGAGEPPVAAHRAEAGLIAVGTDSLASSPDLDVAAELPLLHDIALRQGDSGQGLDEWLLRAATQGGALAMGRKDFGVLEPGARADLAVFDIATSGDPYASFVANAAGSCVATVLSGRLVTD